MRTWRIWPLANGADADAGAEKPLGGQACVVCGFALGRATVFRDGRSCAGALFLDGSASSLYAPDVKRDDEFAPLGPIVSVTTP